MSEANPMVGSFFHSIEDGKIGWQGCIAGRPEPGWYLVQLYDWVLGLPSGQELVKIEDMKGWMFYGSAEDMQHSYEHGPARRFRRPA